MNLSKFDLTGKVAVVTGAGGILCGNMAKVLARAGAKVALVNRSDAAIYKLYRAGILAGNDSAGTFLPNAPITRAEVATILVRMADPNARVLFSLS